MMWSLELIVICLLGMGAVAFITLMERKVLGLTQYRLGPSKVSLWGLLQPVLDGVKLLSKDSFRPLISQDLVFLASPALLMGLFMLMWVLIMPWEGMIYLNKNNSLLFFCCLAVMAYSVILTGWSSTSAFSKIGSMRGILQSLSYEVALILSFLCPLSMLSSFSFSSINKMPLELWLGWLLFMMILVLMEGNRAPFDLLEGESELISGFNIEMGSLMFVYLFLSEYGMILLLAALLSSIVFSYINTLLFLTLLSAILILRSCYPRVRYDSLMGLMWKSLLPFVVFYFSLTTCVK